MPEHRKPAKDPARDVLAAEAFALPAPDPSLTHGPVVLPDDPTGIAEPHDILAAEEFAMPASARSSDASASALARRAGLWPIRLAAAIAVLMALGRVLRRRRRRA